MPVDISNFLPVMRVRNLAETWQAWQQGKLIAAFLGNGSKISAVGRPCRGVCEVHSEDGKENRESREIVFWRPCDADGKWEPGPSI